MSEKHQFQAEIQQVLDIVIHSLYTDREIFVRELASNASDACERLRFLQTAGNPVHQPDVAPGISIVVDDKEGTITITDTGVGMSQAELVENLGTIAHSGTKAFLKQIAEKQKGDTKLIGQFGVGFYSAFMVASQVTVFTRSYDPAGQGVKWTSEGAAGYEIEPAADLPRGTKIVLKLKDDAKDFASASRIESLIKRYSNFIQFPIELDGKRLNTVQAIWSRSKNEIKEEEYDEFYRYLGHDTEKPLLRLHFTADAPLSIQALLFVPSHNWEQAGMFRSESEVSLYCKKVMIQHRPKELFPEWLRFLKGVVDSEDMPLNISRETMQDTSLMQKLNKVLTGRFIKFLDEQSQNSPDTFLKFYNEYQRFLKEGIITDYQHKEALGKLIRFESSSMEKGKLTPLADYVTRMNADQKEIYYIQAPNRESAEKSPYYEVFKSRNMEVLFLYDPWDEFVMEHLATFQEKPIRPAEKAELQVSDADAASEALSDDQAKALAQWIKETLGERVHEVRASKRLVDSPAVVMDSDKFMTTNMKRILKAARKDATEADKTSLDMEINSRHSIVRQLEKLRQNNASLAGMVAEQLFDNARLAAGLVEDPLAMVKRMNALLDKVVAS